MNHLIQAHMTLRATITRFMQRWHRTPPAPAPIAPLFPPAPPPAKEPVAAPPIVATVAAQPPPLPAIRLVAHIQGRGDIGAPANQWVGSEAGGHRVEGFTASCEAPGWQASIECQAITANGSLAAAVAGGAFCGTRGKMLPLHGFVLHVAQDAPHLAGLRYEGVFQDQFRSGLVAPGTLCVSPTCAALLAMRITDAHAGDNSGAAATPAANPGIAAQPSRPAEADDDAEPSNEVSLIAHIAGVGDTPHSADGWAGDPGGTRSIEGFTAMHSGPGWAQLAFRTIQPDGSLGPAIQAGQYCGTRGKGQPVHGFMLETVEHDTQLGGVIYEGAFRDGYRSAPLRPGQTCVSPSRAPMVAMRITLAPPQTDLAAENIRLVIWDLDETFWGGTLSEGGIVWRDENAQAVRELAARGIISAICSKNNEADVFSVLKQYEMDDFFVFSSISWDAKGPRLAAQIEAVQLRAPSVLFIDDNPLNRAEAAHFVPGLNVADEHMLPSLLDHPQLQGKPDPQRKRLAQYHVLQRRHLDQARAGGDTASFLKESGIIVSIEHDIEPHIDRAVELINRTNQLNFTKARLPDDPENPARARDALRQELASHFVQAGLVHVRDRYGDYGFSGVYVLRRLSAGTPELLHFAFSCRILGMGVETWLYRILGRPSLKIGGKVVSDPIGDTRAIDWINTTPASANAENPLPTEKLSYVLLRGACELRPLAHYFAMSSARIIEEFDTLRRGQLPLLNHSIIAAQALRGFEESAIRDAAALGYDAEDFAPFLADKLPAGRAIWVFGFAIELLAPLFRHHETGTILPWLAAGLTGSPEAMMAGGDIGTADPAVVTHLRTKFAYIGRRPNDDIDALFTSSLQAIFARADSDVAIFVVLGSERRINQDGTEGISHLMRRFNQLVAQAAAPFSNIELLAPLAFSTAAEIAAMTEPNHFDRIVYYRMYRHMIKKCA